MTRRCNAISAGFLAVAAALCSAGNAPAQEPQLTTRVIMTWGAEPLDWDQERSLALVVLQEQPATESVVREIAITGAEVITNRQTERFSDVAEKEISWLAEQLLSAFEPQGDENILRTSFVTTPVAHVTTGGTDFLGGGPYLVFWDHSPPPSGATAQSGSRGDVIVLGEFFVRQNRDGAHALRKTTWILVEDSEAAMSVQIAIGLFTE